MILNNHFLLEPNWNATYRIAYTFETNVIRGLYGFEQRAALFGWPRRTLQFDVMLGNADESAYYNGLLYNDMQLPLGVPVWAQQTALTAEGASGTDYIDCTDIAYFEFGVGSWVFIYGGARDSYEVMEIASMTSTRLTFTENLTSTWPIGTYVYPMLPMLLDTQVKHKRVTSQVGTASLVFKETFNEDATHVLPAHTYPGYQGYTVFNQEPNWGKGVGVGFARPSERHVRLGVDLYYSRETESEFFVEGNYLGIDNDGIADLRGFFCQHMGRWKQFWLPTWQRDVVVTSAISAADTSITTQDLNYIDSWAGNSINGKYLFFSFPDGTQAYRKIIGWPSNTQLNLDAAVGTDVAASDLAGLTTCFLLPARLEIDEMELSYYRTGLADTNLRAQSLHDEVMTTTTTTTTTTV